MNLHKTWWGEAFVESLTSFIDHGRLSRGRAYRSDSRILSFNISDNVVKATVRGNINPYFGVHKEPKYKITLSFNTYTLAKWEKVITSICAHPGWLAKLMLNEIPADIDHAFDRGSLLPTSFNDIDARCSCPDYANPCKHIAGVYYRIAHVLDSQPMLLFPLRGLPINTLQKKLQSSDLGKAFAEHLSQPKDIELVIDKHRFKPVVTRKNSQPTQNAYWGTQQGLQLDDTQEFSEPISASIIKKQGDYPGFWTRQNSFVSAMEGIYNCLRTKNKKLLL